MVRFRIRTKSSLSLGAVLALLTGFVILVASFKPYTHVAATKPTTDDLADGSVTLLGAQYEVPAEVRDAIRNFPSSYRAGVIGPDGFPDIFFGQSIIHPDNKCKNGSQEGSDCSTASSKTVSDQWLQFVYDQGWAYYNARGGDAEGQRALAFTYGFLAHAAGDMWGHTLINSFAGGIFPSIGEVLSTQAALNVALRHIVAEGYIGKRTPTTTMTLQAPIDFIDKTFIRNTTARQMGKGSLPDKFLDLKEDIRAGITGLDTDVPDICFVAPNPACDAEILEVSFNTAKITYGEAWINLIDAGLDEWPKRSEKIATEIFVNDDFDAALSQVDDYATHYLAEMLAGPVGVTVQWASELANWASSLVDIQFDPFRDLRDYLFKKVFGMTPTQLKDYFKNPDTWITNTGLGFSSSTPGQLDALMHLQAGKLSIDQFAAFRNTTVTTQLALLDPAGLDRMLYNNHVGAIYRGSRLSESGFGDMQKNAMLGFVRSLDANHQWRLRSPTGIAEGGRRHGDGMPLWHDCLARLRAFRKLYADWVTSSFPDLGEACEFVSDDLPPVDVLSPQENLTIRSCRGLPIESELINHQAGDISLPNPQPYSYYVRVLANQQLSLLNPLGGPPTIIPQGQVIFHRVVHDTLPAFGHDTVSVPFFTCNPGDYKIEIRTYQSLVTLPINSPSNLLIPPRPPYLPKWMDTLQSFILHINTEAECQQSDPAAAACGSLPASVRGGRQCPPQNQTPVCHASGVFAPLDVDNDSIPDAGDNCIVIPNHNQLDDDADGIGNVCEWVAPDLRQAFGDWGRGAIPDVRVYEAWQRLQERLKQIGPRPNPCLTCPEGAARLQFLKTQTREFARGRISKAELRRRTEPLLSGVSQRVVNAEVTSVKYDPEVTRVNMSVRPYGDAVATVDLPFSAAAGSKRVSVRVDGKETPATVVNAGGITSVTFRIPKNGRQVEILQR